MPKYQEINLNFLTQIFIRNFERKQTKPSITSKILKRFTWPIYRKLYARSTKHGELAKLFWGREGGFLHAKSQFQRESKSWSKNYSDFYEMAKKYLNSNSIVVEIGCSAGQWPKRLGIDELGCRYSGYDINAASIEFANQYFREFKKITFECENIENLQSFEGCTVFLSCQTLFFLHSNTVKRILNTIPLNCVIIIHEPVNLDFMQYTASKEIDNDHTKTVGFSHNYFELLSNSGFFVLEKKELFFDKSENRPKIVIAAVKKKKE